MGPDTDAEIVLGVLFSIKRHQHCTHSQNGEEKKPEWECLFSMSKQ